MPIGVQSLTQKKRNWKNGTSNMQNTQFFVGWGTLSLLNAGLAQAKNRSGFLWWVASIFLGPLATLLIVVLPKHKDSP